MDIPKLMGAKTVWSLLDISICSLEISLDDFGRSTVYAVADGDVATGVGKTYDLLDAIQVDDTGSA